MIYKVNEIFASLKGEGLWLGTPMLFVRLANCNLACDHCDTRFNDPIIKMSELEIANELLNVGAEIDRVVITGGEPTIQDLRPLISELRQRDYQLHLETNGTNPILEGFDWICVSPKLDYSQPLRENIEMAHEVKMPICRASDLERAEEFRSKYSNRETIWYLHPWNDMFDQEVVGSKMDEEGARTLKGYSADLNHLCIAYAKRTGTWRVSLQAHKVWSIR